MCPLIHLEQKKLANQPNLPNSHLEDNLIPLCNLSFPNSSFGITKPIFSPK